MAWAFLLPAVGAVALFSFLAVNGWAQERRKEREAYYRYEFRKEMVSAGKMSADDVHRLMQFEHDTEVARGRQGSLVGGFVLLGVGVGILIGLQWIGEGVWMVGFIPLFIGVALLLYALFLAPKAQPVPPPGFEPPAPQ